MGKRKSSAGKTAADSSEPFSIEEAIDELGTIVEQLESGESPLEASLQQFERGMQLLRQCHSVLDNAAARIELITRLDTDGQVETEEFDGRSTVSKSAGDAKGNPGLF
jgi:exodeoxyribonuclease VII small subunit